MESSGAPGNVPAVVQQAGASPSGGIELLKGHLGTGCDSMGCGSLTYLKVQGCMPLALGDKRRCPLWLDLARSGVTSHPGMPRVLSVLALEAACQSWTDLGD